MRSRTGGIYFTVGYLSSLTPLQDPRSEWTLQLQQQVLGVGTAEVAADPAV
jgi:hypothetical protein